MPQGSVLGPTLFLMFINDICDVSDLNVTIIMFADDAKIYSVLDLGLADDLCTACNRIVLCTELANAYSNKQVLCIAYYK